MPKKVKKQELTEKEKQELYEEERKREERLALYRQVRINELEDVFNNILEQIKLDPNYYYKNKADIDSVIKEYSKLTKAILENSPEKVVADKIKEVDKLFDSVNKIDNHYIDRMLEEKSISYSEIMYSNAMLLDLKNQYMFGYDALKFMTYIIGTMGEQVAYDTALYLDTMNINVDTMCQAIEQNNLDPKKIAKGIDMVRNSNLNEYVRSCLCEMDKNDSSKEEREFFQDQKQKEEMLTIGDGSIRGVLEPGVYDSCCSDPTCLARVLKSCHILREAIAVELFGAVSEIKPLIVENDCMYFDEAEYGRAVLSHFGFERQVVQQEVQAMENQVVDTEEDALVLTPPTLSNGNNGSGMMPF